MTNKQIIINNADVSGCEHYNPNTKMDCLLYPLRSDACKNNPNCYYKQYKRKEQSEENLVKQIQTICDFINNRPEIFKGINGSVDKIITNYAERKEQECEEWEKELHKTFEEKDKLHLIIDRLLEASGYDTNIASTEDFEDVYENMRYEKQQLNQLEATLTEIKEITEKIEDECGYLGWGSCANEAKEQILQKISECEVKYD